MAGFERNELARSDLKTAPCGRHGRAFAVGVVEAALVVAGLVQAGVDQMDRPAAGLGPVMQQAGVVAFDHAGHVRALAQVVRQIAARISDCQISPRQASAVKAVQRRGVGHLRIAGREYHPGQPHRRQQTGTHPGRHTAQGAEGFWCENKPLQQHQPRGYQRQQAEQAAEI